MRTAQSRVASGAFGRIKRRLIWIMLILMSACGPALGFFNDTRDEYGLMLLTRVLDRDDYLGESRQVVRFRYLTVGKYIIGCIFLGKGRAVWMVFR